MMKTVLGVAAGVVLALLIVTHLAKDAFDGQPEDEMVARLQTDSMIARLEAGGMVVIPAQEYQHINLTVLDLADDTTAKAAQIRWLFGQLDLAGAQLRAYTEMSVRAEAELEGEGRAFGDTIMVPQALPDSVAFALQDRGGTFGGTATVFPRQSPWEVRVSMVALVKGIVTVTEAPDGRVVIGALPADPRVSMALENAYWSPPPPIRVCTVSQQAKVGISSVVVWEGAKKLADVLGAF